MTIAGRSFAGMLSAAWRARPSQPLPRLRLVDPLPRPRPTLATVLIRMGAIRPSDLVRALALQSRHAGHLGDILLSHGMITDATLLAAQERQFGARRITMAQGLPDARLIDRLGGARCLALGCLPWALAGGVCIVATAQPERFEANRPTLEAALGPVAMALVSRAELHRMVLETRSAALRDYAETCVPEALSCRDWTRRGLHRWLAAVVILVLTAAVLDPVATGWAMTGLASGWLAVMTGLKLAAAIAARRKAREPAPPAGPVAARLPVVSIMVPLFREPGTVRPLINRLARLSYPRDLFDVLLVVEEHDTPTRRALEAETLPHWMRVIPVPDAPLRTKPRALNFALLFARGSIVGIYDAEDAPEPDQIIRVARHFARADPQVACVQGMLDYFNPGTNWLSRCFTLEYAAWFRLLLPGKERLGLVLPLGGTTLFFRRGILERLGGWDAHNVTEDADLGIRLARQGFRTEILDTTTFEEANCHLLPWIKQRSRWIKGYAITYFVHMRDPRALLRDLGLRRFAGFQVQFLGTLMQVILAPMLLSFWALVLGFGHPLQGTAPAGMLWALSGFYMMSLAADMAVHLLALHNRHHRALIPWVLTLPLYFPLATIAAYKALWELMTAPFYWDKTEHGKYASRADATHVARF